MANFNFAIYLCYNAKVEFVTIPELCADYRLIFRKLPVRIVALEIHHLVEELTQNEFTHCDLKKVRQISNSLITMYVLYGHTT